MSPGKTFCFGTKAETLRALQDCAGEFYWIPPLLYFTRRDWQAEPEAWTRKVRELFGDSLLAVRSSALLEDGAENSGAGENDSLLSISADRLSAAVEQVFASYRSPDPLDQVLIQAMVPDIAVSGVITTYVVDDGAPYVTLSYDDESGKPDAITGGVGVHKTVLVHRDTPDWMMDSPRLRRYRTVDQRLMVTLAGRPFIDVRNSFNSFLPAGLDASIGSRLVDGWLARLEQSPELHDKVEFEVALTAYDFTFEEKMDGYPDLLD